ncbi:MAG: hypothetical protein RLY31_3131 [Bacteroidota bacterium]|jgi:tRNA dimethylallyltransferase
MSDEEQKFLVVIGGATATGKTELAIRVARHFDTEIISADSRQIYREMSVGTAKPSESELAAVPHHFIGSVSIHEPYSVGRYEADVMASLEQLYRKHRVVVMAGGSGLYLKAVCEGLDVFPSVPDAVVADLNLTAEEPDGLRCLQQELKRLDPSYYRTVDIMNPRRLVRALSICYVTGLPYSRFLGSGRKTRPFTPVHLLLGMDRQERFGRIDARVDQMLAAGLEQEVRSLFPYRHLQALQTVGYQEMFRHVEGEISLATAVGLIRQHTRQYAKRQDTWFRNQGGWTPFHPSDSAAVIEHLDGLLRLGT